MKTISLPPHCEVFVYIRGSQAHRIRHITVFLIVLLFVLVYLFAVLVVLLLFLLVLSFALFILLLVLDSLMFVLINLPFVGRVFLL